MKKLIGITLVGLLLLNFESSAQDHSIGINVLNPNPNAALHISSNNGNQGVLLPSLTTIQRNALSLDSSDTGLLIYDSDLNQFVFWNGSSWTTFFDGVDDADSNPTNEIQDLSLVGNILTITNNGAATSIDLTPYFIDTDTKLSEAEVDAFVSNNGYISTEVDGSTTNEIQDLTLSGNNLTITENASATAIDLSAYLDDTDTKLTEAEVDAFVSNNGYISTEVDGSTTNEIQDLSLSGNNLSITGNASATTIDLSAYLDDTDTKLTEAEVDAFVSNNGYISTEVDGSTTNEIQDLSLSGNNLTITGNASATTIDLSAYLDDTDTNLTEAEVDAFVANNGYISTEVDGSTTNEIQTISFDGSNLSISDGNSVDISVLGLDSDADPLNEIQDLSLSGNNLTITGNTSATTIDLSAYLDDTDTKLTEAEVDAFVANNGYISAEVDGSTTNEIQDLSLSGNNLTITGNASATTIDLSTYLDDTDTKLTETEVDAFVANNGYISTEVDGSTTNEIQDLSLSGNNLTITGNTSATTIDLSTYLDDTDTKLTEAEVDAFVANNGYISTEVDGSTTNEIQDLSLSGNNLTITGNASSTTIDLSTYLDDTDTNLTEAEVDAFVANNGYISAEVDGSTTNEIQDLSLSGNNLTITGNASSTTIDLSTYLDDTDTNLTEAEVDAFVANNGYISTEVDGSATNEIQDLSLSGNNLTITGNASATTIDLSTYLDDTDTNLTEAEVDAFVANNGYISAEVDGSITNEIQTLSKSGVNITLSGGGGSVSVEDGDFNSSNELQNLTFDGSNINISSGTGIDVSTWDLNSSDDFDGDYASLTNKPTLGALAALNSVSSNEITNGTITSSDINSSIAGDGLAGGAGTSLSVQLNSFSGLELRNDTLRMEDVFANPGSRTLILGGTITVDKKGRTTAINGTPSDIRLKEEIIPLSGALEKIDSLGAYTYYYKNGQFDQGLQYGFMAQELERVYPDLVEENNGYKSIKFGFVIPILFQAVKEQKEVISTLSEEVKSNRAEIKGLKDQMSALEEKLNLLIEQSNK